MFKMRYALLLSALLALSQCSDDPKTELPENSPIEEIYKTALNTLVKEKNYKKAAGQFEEVSRQHPFSPWAAKADLMAAYSYYEAASYENAIANLEDFLSVSSTNKYAPYAQYLLGMCYYVQLSGVSRDQSMTRKALETFQEVVKKYPKSIYARDAQFKIDLCKEHLAGHDMEVGRFYEHSSLPVAALDRFTHVVQTYQTTSHVPEALHRMVEIMLSLSMQTQALVTASVLGYNYPGSKWYQYTYDLLRSKNLLNEDDVSLTPAALQAKSGAAAHGVVVKDENPKDMAPPILE